MEQHKSKYKNTGVDATEIRTRREQQQNVLRRERRDEQVCDFGTSFRGGGEESRVMWEVVFFPQIAKRMNIANIASSTDEDTDNGMGGDGSANQIMVNIAYYPIVYRGRFKVGLPFCLGRHPGDAAGLEWEWSAENAVSHAELPQAFISR